MSNVKGLAFAAIRNYLHKRYPIKEIEKMKDIIGNEIYNALDNPNPKVFYPIDYYIKINNCIVKLFGNMDISVLKKIGRYSADEAVRGLYRIFFNFGSPQFIIKQAAIVFSKYYDEGKMTVIDTTKNSVTFELINFDSVNKDLMQYICLTIEGWIERAMEISAGKSAITIQEKCRSKNDGVCRFISKW